MRYSAEWDEQAGFLPMSGQGSARISWRSPKRSAAVFRWAPVLPRRPLAKAMTPGSHGSTYGGNPLAMAVGNAVLDVMLADGFLDHVAKMGLRLKQRLAALKDEHGEIIEEVRGQGLMLGLKCKLPNQKLLEALARRGRC